MKQLERSESVSCGQNAAAPAGMVMFAIARQQDAQHHRHQRRDVRLRGPGGHLLPPPPGHSARSEPAAAVSRADM